MAKTQGLWPEVGDFLVSSWGYEQTNIDFYRVVRVSDSSVWLQPWSSQVSEVAGWASEYVVPGDSAKVVSKYEWDENGCRKLVESGDAPVFRKKWQNGVSLNSYSGAWPWNGKPRYASHYA